jgi:Holliday junction resolvase
MTRYQKGANAERELIHILWENGFAVVRVAGSGKTALPAPDLIALNREKKLAFESKAWSSEHLSIPREQMDELAKWSGIAGAEFYIAWKVPHKGWLFLKKEMFNANEKNYTLPKHIAMNKAIDLNIILGKQTNLKINQN